MKFLNEGKNLVKKEENDFIGIWRRIKTRDFSGNTGLAVKNSVYQFSTQSIAKIGSLIFTVILARLLMPELFGLYSLALATIIIFGTISELGIGQTIIRFVSKEIGKGKNGKVKSYLIYLGKIKIYLVLISSILLLISSKYIANSFYQKPIFLALLAGALYLISIQAVAFFQSALMASNSFKGIFQKEILYQTLRVILVPLAVVFALKYSLESEMILMMIILALALSLLITSIFLSINTKRIYASKFKTNQKLLSKNQKSITNRFLLATAVLALSGTFFANIDRVMLGKFVEAEFIGYYSAAFTLIGALIPILAVAAIVLLPIFSRIKGKELENGFKKALRITFVFSFFAFIATISLAYFVILIIFGKEFLPSTNILRVLSLLLFVIPSIAIYQSYYLSQGKPKIVTKFLMIALVINIILNYVFITSLLPYGNLAAAQGAAIATIISQFFYLGGLVWRRKN
ncbi:MAG: oligosaccharide flippase family protein [Candidatus Pacearchaeota archaeon]